MAENWVYFVTNRNVLKNDAGQEVGFGSKLDPRSPFWLRYGGADMKPGIKPNTYVAKEIRVEPESVPTEEHPDAPFIPGSDKALDTIRKEMCTNEADLVVLVHGFDCTFEEAISNAADIKAKYKGTNHPVEVAVFTWPSDGEMAPYKLAYKSDRDDARASAKAGARAMLRLFRYVRSIPPKEWCGRRIHLVAHSMGNYVLRHALQALLSQFPAKTLPRLLTNIFLMAADEDDDAFEHEDKMARLPELADHVHVYYANDDRALVISDVTKMLPNRLGGSGPRTLTLLPQKVVLVDCADVSDTETKDGRHQYYRKRPEVIADVKKVLAGQRPEDIKPGRVWVPTRRSFRIKASK